MGLADWRPTATPQRLRQRAELLATLRGFFEVRGVLEVDTPALSGAAVADPHITSFSVAGGFYLHTSPEFPMKRLLAAGSGPIYQICKVFRQGEAGRFHNPEFTLLEWYRPGFDHHALMDEMDALLGTVLAHCRLGPSERLTYTQAFEHVLGVNPHTCSVAQLTACAAQHGVSWVGGGYDDRDSWLDLLMSHCVQPRLGQGRVSFVYDYPASQAALARVIPGDVPVAQRFEVFLAGMELANGFHELADAAEQARRFVADLARRQALGMETPPLDRHLLAALDHGLPDCAGVALGVDRLLMYSTGAGHIDEVLAFPCARA